MSKVMLARLVSHFPLTSAIFNKDVQPLHSVKPFSLRCSSYSPNFPQKPVSTEQRLSPPPNKALQGTAELWGPFSRKYMCVCMDTCVCACAWAGGDLFKIYSLKNSVRKLRAAIWGSEELRQLLPECTASWGNRTWWEANNYTCV